MLRLLLDEHISPQVVAAFRKLSSTSIISLQEFENGRLLGRSDEETLLAAAAARLTLVTYDLRTISPLLRAWAERGQTHAGVIFVNTKRIETSNIGGLARALAKLAARLGTGDWTNRTIFLES